MIFLPQISCWPQRLAEAQPRTWQELAQQRARQRMTEILDDICSEQEALDMLWEIYYRNGGTQAREGQLR